MTPISFPGDADLLARSLPVLAKTSVRVRYSKGTVHLRTKVRFGFEPPSPRTHDLHGWCVCSFAGRETAVLSAGPTEQRDVVWVAKMIAIRIQALLEADVATDNIVGEPWLAELYIECVANRLFHATKYSKLVLPLPVQPVCGRDVHAPGIGTDLVHHHKLLGMRVRKWPKQEPVNNREDRGVCADSQSQRQDDGPRIAVFAADLEH